jgi:hypothetical protein
VSDEFEKTWKEAVVGNVLSLHLPGRTEENHEMLRITGIRVEKLTLGPLDY